MKVFIRISQILVGILFIISGLVKANDPLGLSYKMQEFFELWSSSLTGSHLFFKSGLISILDTLHKSSLLLSIAMITLEVITGVALLVTWKKKFILYLLLALIVFFTFLTGYAYLSGKFTNCGCFGDCIPITPLTSFLKDLALLALIIFLLLGHQYLVSLLPAKTGTYLIVISLLGTLGLQWYALNYLPPVDCLPFKKGNNIAEQMKPPLNSVPDSFSIKFIYEKEGKRYEFSPEKLPADFSTYKFIDRKQELIRKGNAEPAIKGFSLTGITGEDSTEIVLQTPVCVLFFLQFDQDPAIWMADFKKMISIARTKNIPVYVATSDLQSIKKEMLKSGINIQVFTCDFTAIRTAARTTPTVYILKQGTVYKKYGYRNIGQAEKELSKL